MTATIEELFHVTFFQHDEHGDSRPDGVITDRIGDLSEAEPMTLEQVVEACEENNLDADLADKHGNKRGWVHSTGRSSVGDGQ